MNNDITIVTAFFDIGRGDFSKMSRSNQKYLDYFTFWAKIKNNLVVYTDSVMAEKVKKVREEYNLLDKTTVVIIDDYTKIEEDLLNKMKKIENDPSFLKYRYLKGNPENKALYNYVMLLKTWCIKDAVEKKLTTDMVAWLDFGFNHGGKIYIDSNDFDYKWEYPFENKITFFALSDDNNKPIFNIVQSFEVMFMGFMFVLPASLTSTLWNLMKTSMESLIRVGFIDDDQLLMLMAYREKPELFSIIKSDWFLPIKQCRGNHLKTIDFHQKNKIKLKDKILKKYRIKKRNKKYLKQLKSIFLKDYLD